MDSDVLQTRSDLSALIWTPTGRDAVLAQEALRRVSLSAVICRTLEEACARLREENTGAALLAEEALSVDGIEQIRNILATQPPWSDMPLVLLTSGGRSTETSLAHLQRMRVLGNITLLERPLRSVTLIAAVRSAFASRQRQIQTRNYVRDLEETQRNLAQANADLKQFAFAASHDLQEPLRMVNIFSQLLVERHVHPENYEAKQFAEYIRTGVQRMEALLRDVLHYSRGIHQSPGLPDEPFNLATPIQDAIAALRPEIDALQANISIGRLPDVRGDRNQLALVFQNLISNSIKYGKPDVRPEVGIDATEHGRELLVRVKDNGIGFEQIYAERIFDLFQRLNKSGDATETGLGLAICRRIIEKHGGKIWAESSPGEGATFSFTLPAA